MYDDSIFSARGIYVKRKLSVSEQIENLKAKGVTFEYMDEDAAMRFLRNNSYYFKWKT